MLYYLIICFFAFGNCASVQEVLGPDSNLLKSLINAATSADLNNHTLESLNKNETSSSLLSQILSVNPKDISHIVSLLRKLAGQAEKEISTLDGLLKTAAENLEKKTVADKNAQLALDKRTSETKIAIKEEKSAEDVKQISKAALDKAEQHHNEMQDRVNSEKPGLQNQLKVLKQVIALLAPLAPISSKCPENSVKFKSHCYATLDYKDCKPSQRFTSCPSKCDLTWKTIPAGWEITHFEDKDVVSVSAQNYFGTQVLLTKGGYALWAGTGKYFGCCYLKQEGNKYKASSCGRAMKILIRTKGE